MNLTNDVSLHYSRVKQFFWENRSVAVMRIQLCTEEMSGYS